jgi:SAM-dependent methyltransferase
VRFTVGDVAAMPFEDASFDLVVSTFSVHHWTDARGGFAEVARVLRPGGRALVYDLPDAWGRFETGAPSLGIGAEALPGARITTVRWPGRISFVRRLEALRAS